MWSLRKKTLAWSVCVWVPDLTLFYLPKIIYLRLRYGPMGLFVLSVGQPKEKMLLALKKLRIVSQDSQTICFSGQGWRLDSKESLLMESVQLLKDFENQYFAGTYEQLNSLFSFSDRIDHRRLEVSIRTEISTRMESFMYLTETSQQWLRTHHFSPSRIFYISPDAVFLKKCVPRWVRPGSVCLPVWSPRGSFLALLLFSVFQWIKNYFLDSHEPSNQTARIGVTYHSSLDPEKERIDLLHWWKGTNIPPERVVIIFERRDIPCNVEVLKTINHLGVKAVVMKKQALGNSPQEILWRPKKVISSESRRRLMLRIRVALWVLGIGSWRLPVAVVLFRLLIAAERGADLMKEHGIRALIHYDVVGSDWASCACDLVDGARFREIRSVAHWPTPTMRTAEHVSLMWGQRDVAIHKEMGSSNDFCFLTGCVLKNAQKHDCNENQKAQKFRIGMKNIGAERLLTIFDTTLPSQLFINFFVYQLNRDARWGLFIKPKSSLDFLQGLDSFPRLRESLDSLVRSGRVIILEDSISPAEAGCFADYSIAWGINSAAVVNHIAGHRTIQIDLLYMQNSCVKQWATLNHHGLNRVVFNGFSEFWKKLNVSYEKGSGTDLGVVSSDIVNEYDYFQDGKGSERMGAVISGYLEGMDSGLSWKLAMERVETLYKNKWGEKTVVSCPALEASHA